MRDEVVVSVELALLDGSGRRLDSAPENIAIGVVRLHRWQVHPVRLGPGMFGGSAAYLVKLNYELGLEPGFPTVPWFEVGFHLGGADAAATILDSLPLGSNEPQAAQSYALNRHLELVPVESDRESLVHIPAIEERVDRYRGVGSPSVRWRHSARDSRGVRPGSRSAWILLLVPEELAAQWATGRRLPGREAFSGEPARTMADDALAGLAGTAAQGVLSPVGVVNLFRQYFFEFDTFLGPPAGHLWLSPGGTVEVVETSTRRTLVERVAEQFEETARKSEEGLTLQDDVAVPVKFEIDVDGAVHTYVARVERPAEVDLDVRGALRLTIRIYAPAPLKSPLQAGVDVAGGQSSPLPNAALGHPVLVP